MGGKKRKIPIKKIQKKESRAGFFSRRRTGLYSKASELCLLSGAQMAILTTPCSSNSDVSFYSFGHSSVDGVVAAFLDDQRPVREKNLGLGFWWEDEDLAKSENSVELRSAIESMSKMLRKLKDSVNNYQRDHQDDVKNNDIKKNDLVSHETRKLDQPLNLQFISAICDNLPTNFNKIAQEQDQIMAAGNLDDGYINQELDLDQLIDFESLLDGDYETTQEHPETAETSLLMNSEMEDVSMVMTNTNMSDQGVKRWDFGASERFG